MPKIFTPINQLPLTDVSVVRMKKGGIRFEIACYKNKVIPWRNNVEKDVDDVLQTHTIFTNVSKGQVTKNEDLLKVFNTNNQTEIAKEILAKGEIQISDKERAVQLSSLFRETANVVSEKCVNPETRRPYPISMIINAMKQAHFSVTLSRNAKQHALEVIPKLKEIFPIERAQMKLRVKTSSNESKKLKENITKLATSVECEQWNGQELIMVVLIDPGNYKKVEELTNNIKGGGIMEVLSLKEVTEGEECLS